MSSRISSLIALAIALPILIFSYLNNSLQEAVVTDLANTASLDDVKQPLHDRVDLALLQDFEQTKDPETGLVPRERLLKAYEYIQDEQSRLSKLNNSLRPAVITDLDAANAALLNDVKLPRQDRVDLALRQDFEQTKDLETGLVPRERLMKAYEYIREQQSRQGKAAIGNIVWNERGPDNVGGRTRVIIIDAGDSTGNSAFAGSVSGGIWKTTNMYATTPTWTNVNDFYTNLNVSAMAQDPTDSDILYFGTGEGFFIPSSARGDGIWKSIDGGDTWTQLSSTTGNNFDFINKLIVDGNGNLIAGTRSYNNDDGGIYRSTDGGTTFTEVLERYTATSGSEYDRCADIELSADGKTYYASMGLYSSDGIFKSTDSAKTWTLIYDADSAGEQRIDLTCAPSDSNYIYALVQGSGAALEKIMVSKDAGSTWTTCSTITWYDQCVTAWYSTDFTRNQSSYNLAAVVDPNDKETLYVGGINLFRTTNAGTSWSQVSSWVGCGGYYNVHSDHHFLLFAPGSSDTLLNTNDGGLYITEDAQSSPPVWTAINTGYNVTQYYAVGMHPGALVKDFMAGSQDNGTQRYTGAGINSTTMVTGGDGGPAHYDDEHPDTQITSYVLNHIWFSTDGFATNLFYTSETGRFINPSDYDSDEKILYAAGRADSLMRSSIDSDTLIREMVRVDSLDGQLASFVGLSRFAANTLYLGTTSGRVLRVSSVNGTPTTANLSTGLPGGTVSCVAEDRFDPAHLLVTYSNYGLTSIYESQDSGASWVSVEASLPDMPVRWCMFSPLGGDSALIATELGVFSTTNLNGASTDWTVTNTGMGNVRVDMLIMRESDSMVLAATHGRGLFSTTTFSQRVISRFETETEMAYVGDEIAFVDDSYGATSWSWDFDNDGNPESTEQNPTFAFGEGGYHTVELKINGIDSSTKSIHILPNLAVPYTTSDGGDMESNAWHFAGVTISGTEQLWERGAPSYSFGTSHYNGSNAWVTNLDDSIPKVATDCGLLTPSYNFAASGTYTVSFIKSMQAWYSNGPVGCQMEYSIDGGSTWIRLGSDTSSSGSNVAWYERGPNSLYTLDGSVFADYIGWNNWYTKSTTSHDVSFLAGNSDVRFRFRFKVSPWFPGGYVRAGMIIDDFAISGPSNNASNGGIETGAFSKTMNLPASDSANYFSSNGKLIATIWNTSTHNFGATKVEIDQTGSGSADFDTNTVAVNKIFSKTIKITPTTNNSSATVKVAMYFTEDEASGWKTASGRFAKHVQLFKTTNAIGSSTGAQGVLPTSTVVDSTYGGSGLCVICTFSNGFSGVGAGGGGGGSSGGPLPVELLNFNGERKMDGVHLSWETASEFDNSHFDVMRSFDGLDFEAIGRVDGVGTTQAKQNYIYTDNSAAAKMNKNLFYQLKQIDYSGTYEFSNIIQVKGQFDNTKIVIGPNPVVSFLHVDIDPWSDYSHSVEITDFKGNLISSKPLESAHNTLDLQSLPGGVYLVSVLREGVVVKVEKVVKM